MVLSISRFCKFDQFGVRILKLALCSRLAILLIQIPSNNLIPDHDAQVFAIPLSNNETKTSPILKFLFDGFSRWDAQYFLHISLYGYSYENTLAFFPLFPILVRTLSAMFQLSNSYYGSLICGIVLNIIFFCLATIYLYKLTYLIFKSQEMAFISAVFFCINPASIFFSSFYSESLFCFLTFVGLYGLEIKFINCAIFLLSLSAAARSNGLISLGFILHFLFSSFIQKLLRSEIHYCKLILSFVSFIKYITAICFIFLLPFWSYQFYAFLLYCTTYFGEEMIPAYLQNYALEKDFKLPSSSNKSEWCFWNIPLSYSYVQNHYWEVGFLQYYKFKQIPNFLLAAPIYLIILSSTIKYLCNNRALVLKLGLVSIRKSTNFYQNEKCFVYIIHVVTLIIFCAFFIHVQVTTRLISSSSPVLYWVVADLVNCNRKHCKSFLEPPNSIRDYINFLHQLVFQSNIYARLCCYYFLSYFLIGTVMHVNHLPWT